METLFLGCAAFGSVVLVLQFALNVLGIGGDGHDGVDGHDGLGHAIPGGEASHDVAMAEMPAGHGAAAGHSGEPGGEAPAAEPVGVGHNAAWLLQYLTVQTAMAFLAFFGIAGMWWLRSGGAPAGAALVGLAAGAMAMFGLAKLLLQLRRLNVDGTIRLAQAVGRPARVCVAVPAEKAAAGRVQIALNSQTVEFLAVTAGPALPSGSEAVVLRLVDARTVEIAALSAAPPLGADARAAAVVAVLAALAAEGVAAG